MLLLNSTHSSIEFNGNIVMTWLPNRYLLVQSQQQKHQIIVGNLCKVNNKDNRPTPGTSFCIAFTVNFEQISYIVLVLLLLNVNK